MLERLGLKIVATITTILVLPAYLFAVLLAVGFGVYNKLRWDEPFKEWWVDEGIGHMMAEVARYFLYAALFGEVYDIDFEAIK